MLQYHLGLAAEHIVFKAKLVDMILAAQLLTMHNIFPLPASIFVDNQAAIIAGERPSSKPGHYLSIEFRKLLHELQEKHGLLSCDISVWWIAGHKDVLGNEEADREAKRAAIDKDSTTPVALLLKILQKRLPINTSALKQKHKEDLNSRWKKTWSKSPWHDHLARINNSAPSKKYLKATGFMPKSCSSILFQLHTGHIVLNKHLHRINKSESPNCFQCPLGVPEMVHHFLFDCPRYKRERFILRRKIRRAATSTADLLGLEVVDETLKFVGATGRLTIKQGKVPQLQGEENWEHAWQPDLELPFFARQTQTMPKPCLCTMPSKLKLQTQTIIIPNYQRKAAPSSHLHTTGNCMSSYLTQQ